MLTVKEASELLRLSTGQISSLLRSGKLPGIQFRVGSKASDSTAKWVIPVQKLREAIKQRMADSEAAQAEAQQKLTAIVSRIGRRL
jgi:excisionase family DNA binding protein